jgi:hypothetical protein
MNFVPPGAIETATSHYWRRPDGIVVQRVKPGIRQGLAEARENLAVFDRLAAGERRPCLVDMRAPFVTDAGVREFYASTESGRWVAAMALLIGSAFNRTLGNMVLAISPSTYPTRLFTAEPQALAWLERFARARLLA